MSNVKLDQLSASEGLEKRTFTSVSSTVDTTLDDDSPGKSEDEKPKKINNKVFRYDLLLIFTYFVNKTVYLIFLCR